MALRRPPRGLPGADPFLNQKALAALFLAVAGASLAFTMARLAGPDAPRGHLPWPLVQWALTTPLGVLAVALLSGLVCGLPVSLALVVLQSRLRLARAVDVTALPLGGWPLSVFGSAPGDPSPADTWLGHSRSQRACNLLALAFATLLVMGMLAAVIAAFWYAFTHISGCSASGCPPLVISQLPNLPLFVSVAVAFLGMLVWMAGVERRCGVWFRRRAAEGGLFAYIRRPGVPPEAAAAALARYTRHARQPLAQFVLLFVLALLPLCLLVSGGVFLAAWLPLQWILA